MTAHRVPRTLLWRRIFSLPGTRLGWWSVGSVGAQVFFMVAVLGPTVGAMNAAGLPNLAARPWLIGTVLFVALSPALAGIVTGVVAVIRRGERSILVVGRVLLVVLFLLAEVTQERTRRMIPAMAEEDSAGSRGAHPRARS